MLSGQMFDEDPFFASHREHMRQMDAMFRSPFGFSSGGLLGLQAPPSHQPHHPQGHLQRQVARHQPQQVVPNDLFNFGGFGSMFQNMRRMMDDMHSTMHTASSDPNGQMFSQSSFMSYSSMGGSGAQPKVYQASSSTVKGPGGVRETRKTMRDSESGVEKIAVGHHLGDRGHVVERQRNRRTGDQEENREFINLDEEEAPEFDREWQRQARGSGRIDYRRHHDRSNRRHQALPAPAHHRHGHHKTPSYRDRE